MYEIVELVIVNAYRTMRKICYSLLSMISVLSNPVE